MSDRTVSLRVPGRINVIGDHTDYTGGLVLPTIIDLHTAIEGSFTDDQEWRLVSRTHGPAVIPLDIDRPDRIEPEWARYPAGVLVELRSLGYRIRGFAGSVSTTLPIGGGLSSSAALEVAVARIALSGNDRHPLSDVDLAVLCQRAEHTATGVPCGVMDQLSIAAGRPGFATLIDCRTLGVTHIPIPDELVIEHRFIAPRTLIGSAYADRVDQCARIEEIIGPLRDAPPSSVDRLESDVLRRRARHVVSENRRVLAFVEAIADSRFEDAGRLMVESHRSLAVDFETSTELMDTSVDSVLSEPDVLGARMTGGGFGGCIVVLKRR